VLGDINTTLEFMFKMQQELMFQKRHAAPSSAKLKSRSFQQPNNMVAHISFETWDLLASI